MHVDVSEYQIYESRKRKNDLKLNYFISSQSSFWENLIIIFHSIPWELRKYSHYLYRTLKLISKGTIFNFYHGLCIICDDSDSDITSNV
jgi:hypothetical protein